MKQQTSKKHTKKVQALSGWIRIGLPLFILGVLVASVAGVAIYAQQNQSHATNWTYVGYNNRYSVKAYACKVLAGYDIGIGGRRAPVYQLRMMARRVKGGTYPAGKPTYSIGVAVLKSTTGTAVSKILGTSYSTKYNADGDGFLTSSTLLNMTAPLSRFEVGIGRQTLFTSTGSGNKGGGYDMPYGTIYGPFSSTSVANCN